MPSFIPANCHSNRLRKALFFDCATVSFSMSFQDSCLRVPSVYRMMISTTCPWSWGGIPQIRVLKLCVGVEAKDNRYHYPKHISLAIASLFSSTSCGDNDV